MFYATKVCEFRYNVQLDLMRKDGREVECDGLEIRYTVFPYRGFESLSFRQITSKDGPFRPVFIFAQHFAPHFSTFARYSHWASKGKIQLNGGVLVGIDRDEVIKVVLQGSNAHGRCLAFRIGSQRV